VDLDTRELDAGSTYSFRVRLPVGEPARSGPPHRAGDLADALRAAGQQLEARAEVVAGCVEALAACNWRPVEDAPAAGRAVLTDHGFAGPDDAVLPQSVTVAKDATPPEVAGDLREVAEAPQRERWITVRVEGYDLPVDVEAGGVHLTYSLRQYLEAFPPPE
jgi:hypothetical protein